MATDASERKLMNPGQAGAPEPEPLPCPRCDSTNTKFCYYNNYNFSQPRHFCKTCRRYWTHGGTLRDIPIGGGSRKNAKRSRTSIASSAAAASSSASFFPSGRNDFRLLPAGASPILLPIGADHGGCLPMVNEGKMGRGFTSLLNGGPGSGLLFGLGIGNNGLDDMGYGLGRGFWPISGESIPGSGNSGSALVSNTWPVENGDAGFVGSGDCFALPDLAISPLGNALK